MDANSGKLLAPAKLYNEAQGPETVTAAKVILLAGKGYDTEATAGAQAAIMWRFLINPAVLPHVM